MDAFRSDPTRRRAAARATIALAWRATGDERFLRYVARLLDAWVTTYQPSFNPIDETKLDGLILAYDLTASALPVKTRNATIAFLRKLARGCVERIDSQPRPLRHTFANNWQSHRVKLIAMATFTLDDRKLIAAAQRLFVEQVGTNIASDGTTRDFDERDALHYVTYDLQPLVMAALAARRHNRNWLRERSASGATLEHALDWLVPYALGRTSHEEFAHSRVPFDETRRAAERAVPARGTAPGAGAAAMARRMPAVARALERAMKQRERNIDIATACPAGPATGVA